MKDGEVAPPSRLTLKTYSHLLSERRMPTEYELVTSNLLYYVERGFEVAVPLGEWYRRYQTGSALRSVPWERFADPRATTYPAYTAMQDEKEVFVDRLFASLEEADYERTLSPEWLSTLEGVFAVLRYPGHGFQMIASYVGTMAPCGRIVIAALFQAADEMRRIQRVAYRLRQLQLARPGFAEGSKDAWETAPRWQPCREAVERLLVAYDFGEAFVGLNLCVKPLFDELFLVHFASLARAHGDYLLAEIFGSLNEDCAWHRAWTAALVRLVVGQGGPGNRDVVDAWIEKWFQYGARAVAAFLPMFGERADLVAAEFARSHGDLLTAAGLDTRKRRLV